MMEQTWQAVARARLAAAWQAQDALHLWEILRNPDNTVSRAHMKTFCGEAPSPRAAIKVWRAFLATRFPALEGLLAARQAASVAQTAARQATWQREQLHDVATHGPMWEHQGVRYPHALAFVEYLLQAGYVPETVGIGTVTLRQGSRFLGPMRNKHLNAALAVLAASPTTPVKE